MAHVHPVQVAAQGSLHHVAPPLVEMERVRPPEGLEDHLVAASLVADPLELGQENAPHALTSMIGGHDELVDLPY